MGQYIAVRDRVENVENRTHDFGLRPEQEEAVVKTMEYFVTIQWPCCPNIKKTRHKRELFPYWV